VSKKNAIAKIGREIVSFDGAGIGHLLTVEEVAGLLRCSVSSLNKWRLTGRGPPFVRVGSRVRYRPSDLNTYITDRTVTSTSAEIPLPAASPTAELPTRRPLRAAGALKQLLTLGDLS
jgi:excisionase family DNA binding protein